MVTRCVYMVHVTTHGLGGNEPPVSEILGFLPTDTVRSKFYVVREERVSLSPLVLLVNEPVETFDLEKTAALMVVALTQTIVCVKQSPNRRLPMTHRTVSVTLTGKSIHTDVVQVQIVRLLLQTLLVKKLTKDKRDSTS